MGTYDAAASLALSLISRKGAAMTVTRKTGSSFDEIADTQTDVNTDYTLRAVVLPAGQRHTDDYDPQSLTKSNAIKVLFALKGAPITPRNGDRITWAGEVWTIYNADTINPANDGAVMTTAYARR